MITLALGRDGMPADSDESDFDAWTSYVTERVNEAVGFKVDVRKRAIDDVAQEDDLRGGSDDEQNKLRETVLDLWGDWCAEESGWSNVPKI